MNSLAKLMILFFIVGLLAACTPSANAYTDLSPEELQQMLADKDFVFVNVHIPYEGEIPNTDAFIPFDQIESNLDQLPDDRDAKIVLYCRSDRMSRIAGETLAELGYTNLWNLDGGFNAWRSAGLPFEGGN